MGCGGNGRRLDSGACQNSGACSIRRGHRPQDGSVGSEVGKMIGRKKGPARQRTGECGFTLMETLAALALMGLVLSALASLTAQWLPNWNRGLDRIQRSEMIGMALQQIGSDLAAAEYVPPSRGEKRPLFEGSELSVMFVRTALGPNAGLGLDVVRLSESTDPGGLVTVRSRMTFRPLPSGATLPAQLHFGEPVLLFRAPYRLSFAYSAGDQVWRTSW